jgi:conjugative relaxase-like TrwC/TraI family protein
VIRINAIPNTSAAKTYYRQQDYYVEGQEQTAHWHGNGAERLGLSGQIREQDFDLLCENKHPFLLDKHGKAAQLTAKHVENRRVGYDFTFSVSKSVSVAYALGLDDRLPDVFRGAVEETMAEMEREMETRVRKAGAFENRRTGNMVWADFLHSTSRPINGQPDPQLHIHAVVFNATYDPVEEKWKAGEFGALKANAPYFQASFRSRLANRLQDIGYKVRKTKDDFEIVGIPERAIKEFSRRTAQIEKAAEMLGVTRPETKAKLGATTREAKKEGQTWDSLLKNWMSRVTDSELQQVKDAVDLSKDNHIRGVTKMVSNERESVDWSLRHLLERNSVVSQREMMTTALKHGLGNVTVDGVLEEIGKRKDLIRRDINGVEMVTTQAVLAEENKIVEFAEKGKGRWRPLQATIGRVGSADRTFPASTPSLTATRTAEADKADITTLSPTQQAAVTDSCAMKVELSQ